MGLWNFMLKFSYELITSLFSFRNGFILSLIIWWWGWIWRYYGCLTKIYFDQRSAVHMLWVQSLNWKYTVSKPIGRAYYFRRWRYTLRVFQTDLRLFCYSRTSYVAVSVILAWQNCRRFLLLVLISSLLMPDFKIYFEIKSREFCLNLTISWIKINRTIAFNLLIEYDWHTERTLSRAKLHEKCISNFFCKYTIFS